MNRLPEGMVPEAHPLPNDGAALCPEQDWDWVMQALGLFLIVAILLMLCGTVAMVALLWSEWRQR